MELVLATRNQHKLREFSELLKPHILKPLPGVVKLPPETRDSFGENAVMKARTAANELDVPVIADDSGIVVPGLGGAPGVRSARFAGPEASDAENLDLLLEKCQGISDRRAEYVCALALVWPDGGEELFEGRCSGSMILERRGEGGFGYDPSFVPDALAGGRTMAELTQEEKDAISQRGVAARRLVKFLESRLEEIDSSCPTDRKHNSTVADVSVEKQQ